MSRRSNPQAGLDKVYTQALDWLFPPRCAGCGHLGSHWCPECRAATTILTEPLCTKCGLPLFAGEDCSACAQHDFAFTAARSWGRYAKELRQAILKLKHRRNEALGEVLAAEMVSLANSLNWQVDAVLPIPLAKARLAQRGFNQVELLVRPLARQLNLPLLPQGLHRQQDTAPQMDLTVAQRWANVESAFAGDPQQLRGRSVLLVDDILTTGATLDAAARAAWVAGAREVYALTLARTLFEDDPHFLVR